MSSSGYDAVDATNTGVEGLNFVHINTNESYQNGSEPQQLPTQQQITIDVQQQRDTIGYLTLYKYERFWYTFIYTTYHDFYNHTKNRQSFLVHFLSTGFLQCFSFIVMLLQFSSLILTPTLLWSKQTKRTLSVLSSLRTWHLEPIVNGYRYFLGSSNQFIDNDFDWYSPTLEQKYGDWLNFYFPIIMSLFVTWTMASLFAILFTIHWYKWRQSATNPANQETSKLLRILRTICLSIFHIILQLLPALFIPVLTAQFSTANCGLHYMIAIDALESDTTSACHSALPLTIFNAFSFMVFLPLFFFCTFVFFEWRPEQPNVCGKSHTRFDFLLYLGLFACVFCSSFMGNLLIFAGFIEFIIVLVLMVLHLFTLSYYKQFMNLIVTSALFILIFSTVVSILTSTFMVFSPLFYYSQDNFSGLILFACTFFAIFAGSILTFLRYHIIAILVNDPTALLFWNNLLNQRHITPNDIIVPRSAFEVELTTRTITRVSSPFYVPPRTERETIERMLEVDRVEDLFCNSMDSVHHSSPYVYLSFATFKIHLDPLQRERNTLNTLNATGEPSTNEAQVNTMEYIDPELNAANWAVVKHLLGVLAARTNRLGKFARFVSWFIDIRLAYFIRYTYWKRNRLEERLQQLREEVERRDRKSVV